jgi:hypothetical protein
MTYDTYLCSLVRFLARAASASTVTSSCGACCIRTLRHSSNRGCVCMCVYVCVLVCVCVYVYVYVGDRYTYIHTYLCGGV